MKTSQNIPQLYKQFLSGRCTPEELQELFRYFGTTDEEVLRELITQAPDDENDYQSISIERAEKLGYLYQNIKARTHTSKAYKWKYSATIAATLFIISFAYFYLNTHQNNGIDNMIAIENSDVLPGANRATLTLSDGSSYELNKEQSGISTDKDQIRYTGGDKIASAKHITFATISTPRGGQYKLKLPDGTLVLLNAASSLKYPGRFEGNTREIEISGEVYLEVAKNPAKPFIVITNGQRTEVLGTKFNIHNYDDENEIITTVVEGRVEVSIPKHNSKQFLVANQQTVNTGKKLLLTNVNAKQQLGWINNEIAFVNKPIQNILSEASRWYDIEIQYQGIPPKELFTGAINRNSNLSSLLRILELSDVKFKIENSPSGKKLIVY